jgi:hypothetical protein
MTGAGVAASGFNEMIELGYLLSQSVGLISGDEFQFVILPSVTVCAVTTEIDLRRFTQLWAILTC